MRKSLACQTFSSDTLELRKIRDWLRGILQQQNCSENCTNDAVLAVNEACMNIIQHGYCGRTDGEIILEVLQENDFLIFLLTDFASPVDINKCVPRDLNEVRPGGLGIPIIHSIMDEVNYLDPPEKVGNLLELTLNIHKQRAQG